MKTRLLLIAVIILLLTGSGAGPVTETASESHAVDHSQPGMYEGFGTLPGRATRDCVHKFKGKFDWQTLSPIDLHGKWNFRIMHKDKPSEILDVLGKIEYTKKIDGNDYYFYGVPLENKGNLVRFDDKGAHIRQLKFPVFNIIFLDVELSPELNYVRFPMKVGDEWTLDSTGTVELLGFIKIKQPTTTTFKLEDILDVPVNGRVFHVYRVINIVDRKDGKIFREEQWYAAGIGLIYSDTETYTLELKSYEPGPENEKSFLENTIPLN